MAFRRQSGFTMVELMISLVVLAILAALAAPSFIEYLERYRLRSAVEDTLAVFVQARQGAVEADRNVRLKMGGSTTAWCVGAIQQGEPADGALVSLTPAACDCSAAPAACLVGGERLVVDQAGRADVTVTNVAADFTYDSKGGTLADVSLAPEIAFLSSSGRYGLTIRVSALGQARACSTAGLREIPGFLPCT